MRWTLLYGMGACLQPEFLDAACDFTLAYYGVDARQSDDAIAAQQVQGLLADYLGRAYAEAYFSPEAKADVEEMIGELIHIYRRRIQEQDWMSAETRARAGRKLEFHALKVGYPDSWDSYLDDAEIKSPAELARSSPTSRRSAARRWSTVLRSSWKRWTSRNGRCTPLP